MDLRRSTNLAQAAKIIAEAGCFVGIDSGLMWIAASLQVPTVGLYGASYIPAYSAIQPVNPNATYLQSDAGLDRISVEEVLEGVRARVARATLNDPPRAREGEWEWSRARS